MTQVDKPRRDWRRGQIIVSHTVAVLFAVAVAAVNGTVSWHHGVAVAAGVGETQASLFPLAYDGMMLSGAALAYVDTLRGYVPRTWSVVGLWLGTSLTLLFNVLSASGRGWSAMAIAAVYAVTFLITVEALFHPSQRVLADRRARRKTEAVTVQPPVVTVEPLATPLDPTPVPAPEEPVAVAVEAAPAAPRRARAGRSSNAPARGIRKVPVVAFTDEPSMAMVDSDHE
jgi:hypothetical protein